MVFPARASNKMVPMLNPVAVLVDAQGVLQNV